jgi:GcrA cell cycle regulator
MNSIWTDEKVEILKARRAEGLSCGVIAAEFGISRNAVIGKCTRLGIVGRALDPSTGRVKVRPPHARHTNLLIGPKSQGREIIELPIEPPQCEPVLFIDTRLDDCRWPVEGEGATMLCCGAQSIIGSSWCTYHRRKASAR